jgi:hypothetical protein
VVKVDIGTVALEVPGLSAPAGRRLAERVAEGLGGVDWAAAPASAITLSVTTEADVESVHLDLLAASIVSALRRQLS